MAGEEPVNTQYLGSRDSIEEIMRRNKEAILAYERRVQEEKRNSHRRKLARNLGIIRTSSTSALILVFLLF